MPVSMPEDRLAMRKPAIAVQGQWLLERIADWTERYELRRFDPGGSSALADCEVLAWDGSPLATDDLDRLPALKLVAGFATGYGGVDVAGLRARGIALTNGSGVNAHDVADHAMALLLAFWHDIIPGDRQVRAGEWRGSLPLRRSLRGRHAGIVGLGRIGRAVADRLLAHQLDVRWWGPRDKPDTGFRRADSLTALAQWSDILIIASRAVEANRYQIDASVLDALGPDGLLINVSRGMLVDEASLRERLTDGRLAGAALDVFEEEPVAADKWVGVPDTVLTPHIGGATREGLADLLGQLRQNVDRWFDGRPLLSPVVDDQV